MNLNNKIKLSIILFISLFCVVNAQYTSNDAKRNSEHQEVSNYMNNYVMKSVDGHSVGVPEKPDNTMPSFAKTMGQKDRKYYFMNGNKIAVEIYNYGGIAPGLDAIRGVNNFVWRNLDYVFQFCPIVGASVPDLTSPTGYRRIISDGLMDYTSPNLREVNPEGDTLWQWQPLPGYADPDQDLIASNPAEDSDGDGKPDSWPRSWYNPNLGKYVWPGMLSLNATNADLEVYWAMDDRDNREFNYFPFENDLTRRGLGVQIDGRVFQWSNALAENTIFFMYSITNVSPKDLDTVLFGIYGDPDIGGGSPENKDDHGFFVPPYSLDSMNISKIPVYARSMVYFWDPDMKGRGGLKSGYLGCKFLESPGAVDGIDNDGDGMVDESQEDGIDNDGDWNVDIHDVGVDGTANTGDFGEGDGVPTAGDKLADGSPNPLSPGEPNFEFTDLDESDQIGLTSFNSWSWSSDKISNDESMWNRSIPGNFSAIQQNTDIVFIFGSGYIKLKAGETKRISMALLNGEDLSDLLTSAETVQRIYNQNYQFYKPPVTPTLVAIPDNKKVTLYWDSKAEESNDPITGKDFQGYVIYRSTDPGFTDIQTITDGQGSAFLLDPLKKVDGTDCRWDIDVIDEPYTDKNKNGKYDSGEPFTDLNHNLTWTANLEDPWKGYALVPYQGRGLQYYLGNNSGLVHSYVDSNNVINGQTYYYALVAYDRGDSVGIPPTETTKKITVDAVTSAINLDVNTAMVIAGPRTSGYTHPEITNENINHISGISTAKVNFEILDDLSVKENNQYQLSFSMDYPYMGGIIKRKNYSLLDLSVYKTTVSLFDTNFVILGKSNISSDEFLKVYDEYGKVYVENQDFVVNKERGTIRRTSGHIMETNKITVEFRHYPVLNSTNLNLQDYNPIFDGIKLTLEDEAELAFNSSESKWIEGNTNFQYIAKLSTVGQYKALYPGDYTITFSSQLIDTAIVNNAGVKRVPVNYSVSEISTGMPRKIITFLNEKLATKDNLWQPGEDIIFFKPGSRGVISDTLTWMVTPYAPLDSTITPIIPTDGDVLLIKTKRPFEVTDKYILTTKSGKVSNEVAKSSMDNIYVVPNPYVGLNDIEPTTKLPGQQRGERRIYFENLPSRCTIRIFTLSGDPVTTLEHDSGTSNAREFWNLLNRDGFAVSYGIYIAHIDAPGIGEKLIKFAIIK